MTIEAQNMSEVETDQSREMIGQSETTTNVADTEDVADKTGTDMPEDTPCEVREVPVQPRQLCEHDLAVAVSELLEGWTRVGGTVLFNTNRSFPAVSQFVCKSSKCGFAKVQAVVSLMQNAIYTQISIEANWHEGHVVKPHPVLTAKVTQHKGCF